MKNFCTAKISTYLDCNQVFQTQIMDAAVSQISDINKLRTVHAIDETT